MSDRVCYIRRTDRGGALRGLRLIGPHTDDTWQAGAGGDPALVMQTIDESAAWVRDRLASGGGPSKSLGVLCLDPDGAVCSWVKGEDADPVLLDAAITSAGDYDPDALEPEPNAGLRDRFPKLPLELGFEALNSDETSTGSRAAVMAAPDVPGRLLKDALDAMGIRVERFTTLWHAMAGVWDPGAGPGEHSAQRIVSSDAPIAAVIAADSDDGRLVWTWSRGGRLICAGTSRIRVLVDGPQRFALVRDQDIARLCADWLGWSSQLGVSPSRIVFVGSPEQEREPAQSDDGPNTNTGTGTGTGTGGEGTVQGLSPAQIGTALSRAWPEATIDLIGEPDPVGATLRRLAQGELGGDLPTLGSLSNRPTRAHRSMYRWGGLALVGVAAVICIFAYQLFSYSGRIQSETSAIVAQRTELLNAFDPQLVISPLPVKDLETTRDQIARAQGPIQVVKSKPIMQALDTISYVLGTLGIDLDKITLNGRNVTVTIRVADVKQAEQINQSLRSIQGSHLVWRSMTPTNRGEQIQATYIASWDDGEGAL